MAIHSKILVHWTGNSGKGDIETLPDEKTKAEKYVERLKDDYEKGLYTKRKDEASIRGVKIKDLVRICFTEIRLSQAREHASRFGKLGIGFARDFIMDRGGRPVIYVPYRAEPNARLLEDSILDLYQNAKEPPEVRRSIKWLLAHVARMSDGKDLNHYEEMEWRLVYDENPNNRHFTKDTVNGVYRLRFEAGDIKVIIFPNDDIERMALRDATLIRFFAAHMPIMATLDDCSDF